MPEISPRVLVVEDDDAIRTLLVAALRREPFEVDSANDGDAALRLTRECEYAAIVLDLMMPRVNGFEFLEAFHGSQRKPRSVIFVVTAFDDVKLAKLQAKHVHAIIRKPFDVPQLITMIREVVLLWKAHTQDASVEALPAQPDADDALLTAEPTN